MDIRTKLALALVTVALTSMFLIGSFAYRVSADLLQEISERQLDALAEAKEQDLQSLLEGWRNDVRLIRSRTQLRLRLRDLQDGPDPEAVTDMQRIIDDALSSTEDVRRITIFDRAGNIAVSTGRSQMPASISSDLANDEVRYIGFFVHQRPHLVFHSRIRIDNETIGGLEVVIAATQLESVVRNYRGLGETGETLVFAELPGQRYVLLHGLRHSDKVPVWDNPPGYVRAAGAGVEQVFTENTYDYRDKAVWVATRSLEDPGWGLIVKVDADEETLRARALRSQLIDLGLALGAFAILGGTLLGFYLARPIRELASVIERANEGDASARADETADDEIGFLAATLNAYLDKHGPHGVDRDNDDRRT
ncbi:MAG: HAMP domain-containing protein [Gammaproteobacteria bacterium]|nr:HAMP domain-containing protein [Gammaproteobacteria bacterium]